jgi:hypothetical protein
MKILADISQPIRQPYEIDNKYTSLIQWIEKNPDDSPAFAEDEKIQELWGNFFDQYLDSWHSDSKILACYTSNGTFIGEAE